MSQTYRIPLSNSQRRLFLYWDKQWPITKQEIERNRAIVEITKNIESN